MRYLTLLSIILLLSACSGPSSESPKFYKYAASLPPLQVPADIKNPTGESYYPIPPIVSTAPANVSPPLAPPGSQLVPHKKTQLPVPTVPATT